MQNALSNRRLYKGPRRDQSSVVEMECDLTLRLANIKTLEEFLSWEYECDKYIKLLRKKCREKRRTGMIQSAVAEIAHLEGVRNALCNRFVPISGYNAYCLSIHGF